MNYNLIIGIMCLIAGIIGIITDPTRWSTYLNLFCAGGNLVLGIIKLQEAK